MKKTNVCPICGGKLEKHDNQFVCLYCKNTFEEENVLEIEERLNSLLDEFKQELVANTRTQLWDALHEKYISSDKILDITRIIKTYLPEDFMANFFEFVNTKSNTQESINEYINNIDYKENYIYIDLVLDFMIRSLEPSNLLCLNNLIENTYKYTDLKLYNDYTSRLSLEAEKVEKGVYDLNAERDVFIAYSSKDIKYVEEITKELGKNGITYFVALKNLRHGKGAVENYDRALEQAIENSKTFLFISSENSRTRECDALKKEIPYLKKVDKRNAPAEYRNDYAKMPRKYKKPRVQLLIGDTPTGTAADNQIAEIFDGYEWRYDIKSAVDSVYNFLSEEIETETETDRIRRELEEKQAKQQEDLKKMMADFLKQQQEADQKNKETEAEKLRKELEELKKASSKPQPEESEAEKLRKELEELKKSLSGKKEADSINKSAPYKTTKPKEVPIVESKPKSTITKEGKTIIFGSYYNKDNKTLEPLKWDILKEKDGKALVITHNIIDAIPFDINKTMNYEKSSIRQWLNNDFYNKFSDEEKKYIELTQVDNSVKSTGKSVNKCVCNDTEDRFFLLSFKEANTYYKIEDSRKAQGTNYAKNQGLYVFNSNGHSGWWLRSPEAYNSGRVNYCNNDGHISFYNVISKSGVRPVCWLNLRNEKKEKPKSTEQANTFKIEGNVVTFGSYYNKNDKTKEPLEWDILEEKDGKALIITHNIIDSKPFDKSNIAIYAKSFIRAWINGEFYNAAFSEEEKNRIQITLVDNSLSSTGDSENMFICDNTNDKVFLLSVKEAQSYYSSDESRKAEGTAYAKKQGLSVNGSDISSSWRLRSAYHKYIYTSYNVSTSGNFYYDSAGNNRLGIRPACWIKLD